MSDPGSRMSQRGTPPKNASAYMEEKTTPREAVTRLPGKIEALLAAFEETPAEETPVFGKDPAAGSDSFTAPDCSSAPCPPFP